VSEPQHACRRDQLAPVDTTENISSAGGPNNGQPKSTKMASRRSGATSGHPAQAQVGVRDTVSWATDDANNLPRPLQGHLCRSRQKQVASTSRKSAVLCGSAELPGPPTATPQAPTAAASQHAMAASVRSQRFCISVRSLPLASRAQRFHISTSYSDTDDSSQIVKQKCLVHFLAYFCERTGSPPSYTGSPPSYKTARR
jgi:hypothetical protein